MSSIAFTLVDIVAFFVVVYFSGLLAALLAWKESRKYRTPNFDGNRGIVVLAKVGVYSVYYSILGLLWISHDYVTQIIPGFIRWVPKAARWLVRKNGGSHL